MTTASPTKSSNLNPRLYLITGLSAWPLVLLLEELLQHQSIFSMLLGYITGCVLVFRWLFITQKPSWSRACNCGLLFVGYHVWFVFWWLFTSMGRMFGD